MKMSRAAEAVAGRAAEMGIEPESLLDFEAARRRAFEQHLQLACIRTYKPVIDDGPGVRVFETMADYRAWCNTLPRWLGYGSN